MDHFYDTLFRFFIGVFENISLLKREIKPLTGAGLCVQLGALSSHDPGPGPQTCVDSRAVEPQITAQAPDLEENQSLFPL